MLYSFICLLVINWQTDFVLIKNFSFAKIRSQNLWHFIILIGTVNKTNKHEP